MTLDNTAKIGDIITALEGMQAINQKAELASVIGSPATATDNIATQITKIQDAKDVFAEKIGVENTTPLQQMAESLAIGKNYLEMDYTFSTSGSNEIVHNGGFIPVVVIAIRDTRYQSVSFNLVTTDGSNVIKTLNVSQNSLSIATPSLNESKISINLPIAGDYKIYLYG